MKIIMINGSRNPEGQTARAADALLDGFSGGGGEVERVFLPTLDMDHCIQCEDSGWGICRREGICLIEDDFAALVEKVRAADAVAFATPVYWGDLSESMRAFTDRLRRICQFEAARAGIEDKPVIGVSVAGGGGGGSLSCCMSLEKVLNTCGFDVLDMIPVRRQNLKAKLNRLRLAGAWLATLLKNRQKSE
jgi:multimeric flavodoxin WrbA